jgi:HK97 family phage major capsid protein
VAGFFVFGVNEMIRTTWFSGLFLDAVHESGAAAGGGTATAAPPAAPAQPAQQQQSAGAVDPAALAAALRPAMQSMVDQAVAPLRDQITQSNQRLEQALQPQRQASTIFGGAPGQAPHVQTGEFANTSRGYQYFRAAGVLQGIVPESEAKVELQVHKKLYDAYYQSGWRPEGRQCCLAPMGPALMTDLGDDFCAEIGQMLRQGVTGIDRDEYAWTMQQAGIMRRHQALSQFDDSGLGNFVGPAMTGGFIELLRNREVFSRLGATELTLPPNGRLRFDKQTGATAAYWQGEVPSNKSTPTMTASEPQTGSLDLIAKKLYILTKLPNELLRFASIAIEAFIRADMARTSALAIDLAMLEGPANGVSIKGLINYSGINAYSGVVPLTDGNALYVEDGNNMLAELGDDNHDTTDPSIGFVMRERLWRHLLNARAATHTTGVHDGQFLDVTRQDVSKGLPDMFVGKPVVLSNQISNARSKGQSSDLTYVLCGLWAHWLIARMGVLEFATNTQGDTPFTTDQTWVRAIQHVDAGPRYENAFVLYDEIDMDLPTFTGT